MILPASELATELFDEVQSPRCMFAISITTAKLPAWSRRMHGITQYKSKKQDGMTLAKVKEQDGMTLAKVRHAQVSHAHTEVPSIPTSAA